MSSKKKNGIRISTLPMSVQINTSKKATIMMWQEIRERISEEERVNGTFSGRILSHKKSFERLVEKIYMEYIKKDSESIQILKKIQEDTLRNKFMMLTQDSKILIIDSFENAKIHKDYMKEIKQTKKP